VRARDQLTLTAPARYTFRDVRNQST
jgi:hypothetical protein